MASASRPCRWSLTVSWAGFLPARQTVSALAGVEILDLSGLIDTLANLVGAPRAYRLAPVASDVPECSVRRIPVLAGKGGTDSPDNWPNHWPSPARLLSRPEPIETLALLPDHPPA